MLDKRLPLTTADLCENIIANTKFMWKCQLRTIYENIITIINVPPDMQPGLDGALPAVEFQRAQRVVYFYYYYYYYIIICLYCYITVLLHYYITITITITYIYIYIERERYR